MSLSSLSKKVRWLCCGLLICAGYVPSVMDMFRPPSCFSCDELTYCNVSAGFSDLFLKDTLTYGENAVFNLSFESDDKFFVDFSDASCQCSDVILDRSVGAPIADVTVGDSKLDDGPNIVSKIKLVNVGKFPDSKMIKGEIKTNFYADARSDGVPASVIDSVIMVLSEKVDFRRSLKHGDVFEILYSKKNEMLYAKIKTKRKEVAVYRVNSGKANIYCFANGEQANNKAVVAGDTFGQPLRGRLVVSDHFGIRRHPIKRILHHHNGVDLRVNYGEPVYAIYGGVVRRASRYYGYGNCVDVKHPHNYSSRYAHLSRISVRFGQYVKKGQLLGFAGNTGEVTGTHLHLELAKNNRVINPMNVKMVQTEKKTADIDMRQFNLFKKAVGNVFLSK